MTLEALPDERSGGTGVAQLEKVMEDFDNRAQLAPLLHSRFVERDTPAKQFRATRSVDQSETPSVSVWSAREWRQLPPCCVRDKAER